MNAWAICALSALLAASPLQGQQAALPASDGPSAASPGRDSEAYCAFVRASAASASPGPPVPCPTDARPPCQRGTALSRGDARSRELRFREPPLPGADGALRALSEALGREVHGRLITDAPHNLVWELGDDRFLHRKGACPALGPAPESSGPFRYTGHPVIVPGSMGDASYALAGLGNGALLESASHGAGRSLSRGKSIHFNEDASALALSPLRVVTAIDPDLPRFRARPDILEARRQRLKEEAPYAHKPVTAVIRSVEEAAVAQGVARFRPLVTVKG